MINTSVDGEYLDSRRADPFWDLVTRLDVPVFLHPPRETIGHEDLQRIVAEAEVEQKPAAA